MKTLHVLGLPHTVTNKDSVCRTTQKIYRFCRVFQNHPEYRVIHYGHNKSDTAAKEHVAVTSDEVLFSAYGEELAQINPSTDDLAYKVFHANTARALSARKQKGDILLAFNKEAADIAARVNEDNAFIVVEPSVSSSEAFALFRCYESYPLKSSFIGATGISRQDPQWYWRVVPPCFDTTQYSAGAREAWCLYIGDVNRSSGLDAIIDACGLAGVKLKVCGKGSPVEINKESWPPHVEQIENYSRNDLVSLMSRAFCGFFLNFAWEPFGDTVIEMMLSGCVPITTDIGAMTEYIVDGLNGFRCNTFSDIIHAIGGAGNINRTRMINFAKANFSYEKTLPKYERAFRDFEDVINGKGWYEVHQRKPSAFAGLNFRDLYV